MAQATRVTDYGKWSEELARSQDGYRGFRHFRVDSTFIDEVMAASGLPNIGDPWSQQLPLVAAREVQRVLTTREDSIVRVTYASPRASLFDPGGAPHTELVVGTLVATAYQGALASGAPDGVAIEGGAPKEVGTLEARVSAYFEPGEITATMLAGWLALSEGWLNSNEVRLPRVGFTTAEYVMQPDQLLYLGFEGPTQQGDRVVVTHRLRLSPSFDFIEATVDDKDRVIESRPRRIYGSRPFQGLW